MFVYWARALHKIFLLPDPKDFVVLFKPSQNKSKSELRNAEIFKVETRCPESISCLLTTPFVTVPCKLVKLGYCFDAHESAFVYKEGLQALYHEIS